MDKIALIKALENAGISAGSLFLVSMINFYLAKPFDLHIGTLMVPAFVLIIVLKYIRQIVKHSGQ